MTHRSDEELLSAYIDGALGADAHAALERRLAEEPHLADALARMRGIDAAMRGWFDESLDAGPDPAAAGLIRAAAAGRRRRGSGGGLNPWVVSIAASLAILAIGAIAADRIIERRVADALAEMRAERDQDMRLLAEAMQNVLETRESGTPVAYRNPQTGFAFSILPRRTWRSESGHWCREFVETFETGPQADAPVSIACRDGTGVWRRVRTELRNPDSAVLPVSRLRDL